MERECIEGVINTDYVTKYTTLAFLRKIDDINMSDNRGGKKLDVINRVLVSMAAMGASAPKIFEIVVGT